MPKPQHMLKVIHHKTWGKKEKRNKKSLNKKKLNQIWIKRYDKTFDKDDKQEKAQKKTLRNSLNF